MDVVGRVINVLTQATGFPVRMAQEGEREYFAGLLRVVDNTVQIHADFAPHVRSPLVRSKPVPESKLIGVHRTAKAGRLETSPRKSHGTSSSPPSPAAKPSSTIDSGTAPRTTRRSENLGPRTRTRRPDCRAVCSR